jgi:imidazolonepropionase-like amidohydrolase
MFTRESRCYYRRVPRSLKLFALMLGVAFASSQTSFAQDLVITNARILDGNGGVIMRGSVVIEDGRIASVSASAPSAPGGRVIDAAGKTVMPGFIESHRHPIGDGAEWLDADAPARMQEFLDAGFTTILSAGDDIETAIELRRRIADGEIAGPRLIVLGRVATARPPGGAGAGGAPRIDPARSDRSRAPRTAAAPAVPPAETRAAVEAMASAGVDGIKTNIIVTPGGPEKATLTLIVEEAKRFALPVITHAVTVEDTIAAVEAGVQSLAHTPHIGQLTDAQTRMIAEAGIPMISTLGIFVPYFDRENRPLFRDREPFPWETLSSGGQGPVNARLLWEAGITYGFGTDTRWLPSESLALELRPLALMFSPQDIVSILTRNAAAAVHRSEEIGTLETGKLADLVILDGDPFADVTSLLNVEMVVKGGEVVVARR